MQTPPPAGWYPDPSGLPVLRFWDGTAWTASTQSVEEPAADTYFARYRRRWRRTSVVIFLIFVGMEFLFFAFGKIELDRAAAGVLLDIPASLFWGSVINLLVAIPNRSGSS